MPWSPINLNEKEKLRANFGDYLGQAEVVIYSILAGLLFITRPSDDRECAPAPLVEMAGEDMSLVASPRAKGNCFPLRDQLKSKIRPELNFVTW